MGLFDNIFGGLGASKTLTKPEAFAGILLGAVASDGHIADEEAQGARVRPAGRARETCFGPPRTALSDREGRSGRAGGLSSGF